MKGFNASNSWLQALHRTGEFWQLIPLRTKWNLGYLVRLWNSKIGSTWFWLVSWFLLPTSLSLLWMRSNCSLRFMWGDVSYRLERRNSCLLSSTSPLLSVSSSPRLDYYLVPHWEHNKSVSYCQWFVFMLIDLPAVVTVKLFGAQGHRLGFFWQVVLRVGALFDMKFYSSYSLHVAVFRTSQ